MRSLNLFTNRTLVMLTQLHGRRYLRAVVSLLVSLSLILQAFPLPGQSGHRRASVIPPDDPAALFTHPIDTLHYASSFFSLYPDLALAQGDVITKSAPATARPGDFISYPIVIEKTDPASWLTATVLITDVAPANTTYASGAAALPWWHGNVGEVGLFRNLSGEIASTGLITVGTFIVQVDSPLPNGTIITNTAHFSAPNGTLAVSPIVTTVIQAPEFSLVKYGSSSPVCAGSLLTYTTVVSNVGPDPLLDVIAVPYTEVDKLPPQVDQVYASHSPVTSTDTITWTMTDFVTENLYGNGTNSVTRTAVVSVPYSLNDGLTLTNHITVFHATAPTASYVLPITVTKVTPDFTSNSPVGFGAPAVFTNTTIGDATFGWDFGDGQTSTAVNPSHVYTSDGVFDVTLTATSTIGCGVLTATHPITVLMPATVTVTANPTNTFANGISNTLVTAVVSDTFGSPIVGQPLTFTTSLGSWTGDGQSMVLTTNSFGVATNTLTSTVAGIAYITVTAPNGISDTTQVVFGTVQNLNTGIWYARIQDAIDEAANGHTLLAYANIYTENVVISKGITLTGELSTTTIIDGNGADVVQVITDNVTLSNFTVRNGGNNVITTTVASPLRNLKISNNAIVGGNGENVGIYLSRVSDSEVTGNVVTDFDNSGIMLDGGSDNQSSNNLITFNRIFSNAIGVQLYGHGAISDTQIHSNNFFGNTSSGIQALTSPAGLVELTVLSNTINSQSNQGLTITGTGTISITALNNIIAGNGGDGILVSNASALTSDIHRNIICSNVSYEVENQATPTVNAIGNWWGHNPPIINGTDYTGAVIYHPPISFTVTAVPPAIMADGTSTSVVSVAMSGGGYALPGPYNATVSTNHGTLWPSQVVLNNGIANTTLTLTSTTYPVTATLAATVTVSPCGDAVTTTTVRFDRPSVELGKFDDPDPVQAGAILTYTLVYTNDSGVSADNIWLTDTLPLSVTFNGSVPPPAGQIGNVVGWGPFNLPPYSSSQVIMTVTVDSPIINGAILTNTALITAPAALSDASTLITTTIWSSHALTVTKSANPDPVDAGATLNYTLAYTVTGNEPALNAVVTDTVPVNTVFNSASGGVTPVGGVLTWTLGDLSPPTSGILTFTVQVASPLPNGTILTNSVTFFDDFGQVASDTITTTVVSSHTLDLAKIDTPDPVNAGATLNYTLGYSVVGNESAQNVTITDTVPANTNYVSCSGAACSQAGGVVTWTLGTLNPGNFGLVTMVVDVATPLPNGTVITNTAYLYDSNGGVPVTSTVTTTVTSNTDIAFTKSAIPPTGTSVQPTDIITYTLVAANTGSQMATGVVMTDSLPAEVNVLTFTATKALPPTLVGNLFTWNIGTLTTGEIVTATIQVAVTTPLTRGTVITNQGELLTSQTGLSTTNWVTHTVISTPTLTLHKSANPPSGDAVVPGGTITYTITVTNSGDSPASNFRITDTVPVSTSLVGSVDTTPGFTSIASTNALTVSGTLGADRAMTVTFAVTISSAVVEGTVFTNNGYVSYAESPVISSTNAVTHVVRMTPVLTFSKMAEPSGPTIGAGETITYTVVVSNNSIFNATNVVLTDVVPANTHYINGSLTSTLGTTSDTGPLVVAVGTLPGGQAMSFTFQVTVTTPITNGTVISNVAHMTADYLSLVDSNAVTHTVVATPDLVVEKFASPPSGSEVDPADPILYRIRVTNNGPGMATNLIITDTVPISTEYVLSQLIPPIGSVTGPDPLVVTVPAVAGNGGQVEYRIVVTVTNDAPSGLVITNAAQISSDETAVTTTNVVTHQVGATPVLTAAKTSVPAPGTGILPGTPITYTVTVTNTGATPLTFVTLVDLLDGNTNFVSSTPIPATPFIFGPSATWSSLPAGDSVSLIIRVNVTSSLTAGTVITNIASASSVETGVVATNPVTHVIVSPVLSIAKTDNVTTVQPGDLLTYTLTISNEGNAVATGLVITDVAPTGTTYVAGSASDGGMYNPATREITWTISILTDSTVMTRTFAVTVDDPVPAGLATITNSVTVSDESGGSATAIDVDVVNAAPNVQISKSPSGITEPGAVITYTLAYTNAGNQTAAGVVISETVPLNTNFNAGLSTLGWSCADNAPAGTNCTFNIGVLAGGNTSGRVTFAVTVTTPLSDGTVISNTAYIGHDGATVITPSNTVTHLVQLRPSITLSKAADPMSGSTVSPADPITYTITVVNNGTGAATGVVITDVLDPNVILNSVTGGPVSSTNPLVLNVGTVAPNGGAVTYTVRVTVTSPLTSGTILTNQAQVTSVEAPTVTLSNLVTHTVVATPNLIIQKLSTTTSTVSAGGSINYAIRIFNTGNAPATNVRITDTIPISTSFFSAQLLPLFVGTIPITDPVVAVIPVLAGGGGAAELRISVDIDPNAAPGTVITNVAQVDSDETVVTNTNVVTHWIQAPNLVLTKSAEPDSGSLIDPGDMITYTLMVANIGMATANGVVVTDTLDGNVNFVDATPSQDSGPNPLVFNVGNLFSGQSISYTVRVTAASPLAGGTIITNIAQVVADALPIEVSQPVTHVITATSPVLLPALTLFKTAEPPDGTPVLPGQTITYTLTVINAGPGIANNLVLSDTLPTGVTAPSNIRTTPGFNVVATSPALVVSGTLLAGDLMTTTFQVTVSPVVSGTVLTNTAQVTATGAAALATDLTVHPVIEPVYDLTITKDAVPSTGSWVEPGELITYTITVVNNADPVTGVVISDTLDPNVALVTGTTTAGTVSGPNPVQVTGINLNTGDRVTVTLVVSVTGTISGTLINNQASVTSTEVGTPVNSGVLTHIISNTIPAPSLAIAKTAQPPSGSRVGPNSTITYTVVVANNGTGDASNVLITDTLPASVNRLSASLSPAGIVGSSNPLTASVGALAAGSQITLTIVVTTSTVPTDTLITNTAQAVADSLTIVNSLPVTHIITSTLPVSPTSWTITKSADPAGGTTVTQNDVITYTIVVVNSGGPAIGVILTDVIPSGTAYVPGSLTSTLGTPSPGGASVTVDVPNFPAGTTMTASFQVWVTTNLTTTITNFATLESDQTGPQNSNPVSHPVQGTALPAGNVYLPIIYKDFGGSSLVFQWDNVEPVRDRVVDADGAAGICFTFPCDGRTDGVFRLILNLGSDGPKALSNIQLNSTQPVQWDTIPGNGISTLGIFDSGPLNSPLDGSIYGIIFNGQVTIHLFASDDAGFTRFRPADGYIYTVTVNFTDGTSLSAQTRVF